MKVVIESIGDQSFTVMELPEEGIAVLDDGPQLPEEGGQTYDSIEGALDAARTLLGGDDLMMTDKPMIEGESDFVKGFKAIRGIDQGY